MLIAKGDRERLRPQNVINAMDRADLRWAETRIAASKTAPRHAGLKFNSC